MSLIEIIEASMLKPGRLKFAKPHPRASAARRGIPWRKSAGGIGKTMGQKMTALAGICASYLQPLEAVERWSILD